MEAVGTLWVAGRLERPHQTSLHVQGELHEIPVFVAERTFGFVDGLLRETRTPPPRIDARVLSDRLDDVIAHRLLGLPGEVEARLDTIAAGTDALARLAALAAATARRVDGLSPWERWRRYAPRTR